MVMSVRDALSRLVDLFGPQASWDPTKLYGNLMVSPNGNTLVGTTTDNATNKLQVQGSIATSSSTNTPAINLAGATAGWASGLQMNNTTATTGRNYGMYSGSDGVYHFTDGTAGADRFTINAAGVLTSLQGVTVSGFGGDGYGQFRAVSGNFGVIIRNDGTAGYLLSTASGAPYGSWSSLRPFWWNMSTGAVTIDGTGGGTTFGGVVTATTGQIWSYGYGGSGAQGVLYLGNSGGTYLYNTGASVTLNSNVGQFRVTANSSTPLMLENTNVGNYWNIGPDGSNSFCVYNSGGAGCFIGWGGTAWSANSDERLKNVRGDFGDALSAVAQIRTVKYSWKADDDECEARGVPNDSRVFPGVIAQDVQKVLPEAVTVNDYGYLAVQYSELIPLALAAITQLNEKVDAQAELIAALQTQLKQQQES